MKHTFCLLLATLLLCTGPAAFSQHNPSAHRCGTTQAHEVLLHTVPGLAESNRALEQQAQHWLANRQLQRSYRTGDTIPVVFHVVYNAPQENIPDVQLLSQLAVLNEDFNRKNADVTLTPDAFKPVAGNPQLVFCLAALDPNGLPTTGITRTNTSRTNFAHTETAMKFDAEGGKSAWNPELYLNIWVVNLAGNFLGFAQFPGGPLATDGIVLMYRSTGRAPANPFPGNYNRGRTATHEVGHWLGLRHIWGEDETSCTDSDLVEDTPNQKGPSSGCPIFPKISDCNPTPPGEMFMNFMDYTNDACMNLFTHGQAARMESFLYASRTSVLSSNMCSNKLNADFRAVPDAIFPGQSTNFFYYSNGRRPASFFWEFEGGFPTTSTSQDPGNIRYDQPGNYTVKLTVEEGGQTATEIKTGYLKVTTNDLQLYPNPASSFISVGAPAGQLLQLVEIYNTAGKRLLQSPAKERTLEIDTRSLANGLYIVRGQTDTGKHLSQRLLILRGN